MGAIAMFVCVAGFLAIALLAVKNALEFLNNNKREIL